METRLSEHVEGLNELLESGEECSLKCPNCEIEMLEFRVAYVIESGGRGGGIPHLGGSGGGAAGLVLGIALITAISVASEASKRKSGGTEYDQTIGETMMVDGCRECGTFWFDGNELSIARQSTTLEGSSAADLARIEAESAEKKARIERIQSEGKVKNCMHVVERGNPHTRTLKQCRRIRYRGTEYCYAHQPK
ncbi:MAG: hypothetical protein EVA35_03690 [Candidatus Poseidoniales archaeon]|nr:MAG: hypothetical protein EVA35_03690 [Candidatus Poseidoniales archaeon]